MSRSGRMGNMFNNRYKADWDCPSCKRRGNYGSRDICKCGYSISEGKLLTIQKIGDWKCNCGCDNFAKRVKCFQCNADKPSNTNIVFANTSNTDSANTSNSIDLAKCKVCLDNDLEIVLPCGHICMCFLCGSSINQCPICRKPYNPDALQRIYL